MHVNKFIKKLLNLKELHVKRVELNEKKRTLDLYVKPYKNGRQCPECQRTCKIVKKSETYRVWRDLPIYGCVVSLWYQPKEIKCPTHGRVQEIIPWAGSYSRVSFRFEYAMLVYCQMMTQKAAAELLKISTSTLSDLLHRTINRIRKGHKIKGLKSIGVDEISYEKGRKYATIVYDLDRSCVIWVGRGKTRETIDSFFNEKLSNYQKKKIKWASCDMSETFIGAIESHCPNATLVLDRFHIAKALNNAVDEVRKEAWRKADTDKRKALKGLRWLLYKHSSNRSKEESRILKALRNGNRRIHRASILKDEFEQFWDYNDIGNAEAFLNRWTTTALKSRLESIRKFVKTIRRHKKRILPFVETGLSNAISEGLNRIIKIVKNRASGFKNLTAFTDMIYLTVGDLDIPARFHKNFRTV